MKYKPDWTEARRRLAALWHGRVHIQLPVENVEPLVRELDPALLMLDTACASPAEGERLLARSVGWARQAKFVKR